MGQVFQKLPTKPTTLTYAYKHHSLALQVDASISQTRIDLPPPDQVTSTLLKKLNHTDISN